MVQRLKEVVAEYEGRLRKTQLVPRFTVSLYRLVLSFWCVFDAGNKTLCLCRLVLSFWFVFGDAVNKTVCACVGYLYPLSRHLTTLNHVFSHLPHNTDHL